MEDNTNQVQTGTEETVTEKTFTQAEVDEMLQRETDRRVTAALQKAEKKNAEKIKEAQKLAQMNEQQKYEYELEQREAAIAQKEKALALAENKAEAAKILAEKGLSAELVNFVVAESADDMNANILLLDKAFKASVKAEVEKRLGSSTPKKNLPLEDTITKERFQKMSLKEMAELQKNNPDIFNQF